MADLFAGSLASKGFKPSGRVPAIDTPETYCLRDDTVYFSWRSVSESCY